MNEGRAFGLGLLLGASAICLIDLIWGHRKATARELSEHLGEIRERIICPVCEDAHDHWRKP